MNLISVALIKKGKKPGTLVTIFKYFYTVKRRLITNILVRSQLEFVDIDNPYQSLETQLTNCMHNSSDWLYPEKPYLVFRIALKVPPTKNKINIHKIGF